MSDLMVNHISYSQMNTVQECPYEYFLLKIAGVKPIENGFSQAGTLAHSILAAWGRGELPAKEMAQQWAERFQTEVTMEFPHYLVAKGFVGKLYDSVLRYFSSFNGFSGYEVVGVEKEFVSSIAGEKFIGVIDLILRHKETGGLMIVDHKSASFSTFKKNREMMYRQLLLYSKCCADTYGTFPTVLCFNLFKENVIDARPFSAEEYMAARIWAETLISEMKAKDLADWFETRPDFFRCTNLCSCRNECCFGKPENHKRKDEIIGKPRTVVAV